MLSILVSVIIPSYNEQGVIGACLSSLALQSYKSIEIILVDDGSSDKTLEVVKKYKVKVVKQNHKGPGPARNLGASFAKGKILVFVDSDMTFEKDFINDLILPIINGKTIGTFSKNEMNANKNNIWSVCWSINRNWPKDRLIPPDYPNQAPVFRAILKEEFDRVGGFDATGEYTDDWSLSRKLGVKSTFASGAVYYHFNPSTLREVYRQARWIGKNEFISGSFYRQLRSLVLYSFPVSFLIGLFKSIKSSDFHFLIFKFIYDFAVWISVIRSFFGENKSK